MVLQFRETKSKIMVFDEQPPWHSNGEICASMGVVESVVQSGAQNNSDFRPLTEDTSDQTSSSESPAPSF